MEILRKIYAGKNAQVSDEFMIFACCESLILGQGMGDAVARCKAYLDAGADGIMIHSSSADRSDIIDFCEQYKDFGVGRPLTVLRSSADRITEAEFEVLE